MKLNHLLLASWSALAFASQLHAQTVFPAPGAGSGSGTVTSVGTTGGLTGGPIVTTGNISVINPSPSTSTSGDVVSFGNATGNLADSGISTTGLVNTQGTGITISGHTVSITNTAVSPATYGDSTHVAQVTINQQGQITGASNVLVSGGGGNNTGCIPPGVANEVLYDLGNGNCSGIAVGTTGQSLVQITGSAASWVTPSFRATTGLSVVSPTPPANTTTQFMQGVAAGLGNLTFTPTRSGHMQVVFQGIVTNGSTANNTGINIRPYYGQGTPPANAAAVPGNATQCLSSETWTNATAVTQAPIWGFTMICSVDLSASLGQPFWFDLAALSVTTASTGKLQNVSISGGEL